jgi:hypothetical protein
MSHPPSIEQTLSLRSQYIGCYERLIAEATDSVAWMDGNFEYSGISGPVIYERLREYLLVSRHRQLRLLMANTHFLTRNAARFLMLQDRFSEQIQCRLIADHKWDGTGLLIVDSRHITSRLQPNGWRGVMAMDAIDQAEPLALKFDTLWEDATPCLPRTTLGL